jgi:hypothetical protein
MDVAQTFTHLNITFDSQRFSNCALQWMLDLWSSYWTVFSETWSSKWIFSSVVPCAAVVLWLFRNNPSQCTTISFCQCWISRTVPLRWCCLSWFVSVDITLEIVALDTPHNKTVFVTDAPAKRIATIYRLFKSDKSTILRFFHTDCHPAQSLTHWHGHYRV